MHLSLEISQGVPGTGESRNPHKPKPPKAAEAAKGTQEMMTVHCAGREGDLLPASVFGRVRLTSCQINIYSQIYLFAFVIENSCGLFFFSLCVLCAHCFVPLVYFWLLSAGTEGGQPQPFLAPPALPAASPSPF